MEEILIFANIAEASEFIDEQRIDCTAQNYKEILSLGYQHIEEQIHQKLEETNKKIYIDEKTLNIKNNLEIKYQSNLNPENDMIIIFALIGLICLSVLGAIVGYLIGKEYCKSKEVELYKKAVQERLLSASKYTCTIIKEKIKEDTIEV